MNEKLKKVARKLSTKYKTKGLDSIYRKLMTDVYNNEDYFGHYKPQDLLKITLYIYSFIRTNDFKLGDNMIENSWIGNLFEFQQDNFANESCNDCGVNGYVDCDNCDGSGEIECNECNGSGQVTCGECDGSGEDDEGDECLECKGGGEVDCDDCDSKGTVSCNECGGDGSETCNECGGNGEIESEELLYMNTSFITWDKELIYSFRNSLELRKPSSIQESLANYYDENRILYIDENESSQEFSTEVEPDKIYCFYLEPLNDSYLTLRKHNKSIWTAESPSDYTP
jgi:hypothetical protein